MNYQLLSLFACLIFPHIFPTSAKEIALNSYFLCFAAYHEYHSLLFYIPKFVVTSIKLIFINTSPLNSPKLRYIKFCEKAKTKWGIL